MDFLKLAKKRYSVRSYLKKGIDSKKLACILDAGRIAPTGANRQPQKIFVVRSESSLAKLKKAADFFDAPLALIVCADRNVAWKRKYDGKVITDIDASIVTDHMMLEATALGIGSLWICRFDPDIIRQEFNLPENLEPVNILALGYDAGSPKSPERHLSERKHLNDIVVFL
jgi:nitroreductase